MDSPGTGREKGAQRAANVGGCIHGLLYRYVELIWFAYYYYYCYVVELLAPEFMCGPGPGILTGGEMGKKETFPTASFLFLSFPQPPPRSRPGTRKYNNNKKSIKFTYIRKKADKR